MSLEHKSLPFEVKAAGEDELVLYAAVFSNVDRQGDVIVPGAFANLPEFVESGWIALNHKHGDLPIATIESASQDGLGLKVSCRWHTTDEAKAARIVVKERMARGKAVLCSIGYRALEFSYEQRGDQTVRLLKSVAVYEASIVNMPANPEARVTGVKAWSDAYETAFEEMAVAQKEGRTLSTRSRDRLKQCRDRMKEACDDIDRMLSETDPQPEPEMAGVTKQAPDNFESEVFNAEVRYHLALCAQ